MYASFALIVSLAVAGSTTAAPHWHRQASATGALAQVSQQCQTAISSAVTGPFGQCLNLPGLVSVASAPMDQSLIAPVDAYINSVCNAKKCNSADFSALGTSLATGCSADLGKIGVDQQGVISAFNQAGQFYVSGQKIACLRDTSANNTLCVTSTLKAIEAAFGAPLSVQSLTSPDFGTKIAAGLAPSVICTPCVQAAWPTLKPVLPPSAIESLQNGVTKMCGADFLTTTPPSTIVSQPATASPTPNGALSTIGSSMSMMGLVGAVGAAFMILA